MSSYSASQRYTVSLPEELNDRFQNWLAAEGIENGPAGIRMLINVALGAIPMDAAALAARQLAYNNVNTFLHARLAKVMVDLSKELEASIFPEGT